MSAATSYAALERFPAQIGMGFQLLYARPGITNTASDGSRNVSCSIRSSKATGQRRRQIGLQIAIHPGGLVTEPLGLLDGMGLVGGIRAIQAHRCQSWFHPYARSNSPGICIGVIGELAGDDRALPGEEQQFDMPAGCGPHRGQQRAGRNVLLAVGNAGFVESSAWLMVWNTTVSLPEQIGDEAGAVVIVDAEHL